MLHVAPDGGEIVSGKLAADQGLAGKVASMVRPIAGSSGSTGGSTAPREADDRRVMGVVWDAAEGWSFTRFIPSSDPSPWQASNPRGWDPVPEKLAGVSKDWTVPLAGLELSPAFAPGGPLSSHLNPTIDAIAEALSDIRSDVLAHPTVASGLFRWIGDRLVLQGKRVVLRLVWANEGGLSRDRTVGIAVSRQDPHTITVILAVGQTLFGGPTPEGKDGVPPAKTAGSRFDRALTERTGNAQLRIALFHEIEGHLPRYLALPTQHAAAMTGGPLGVIKGYQEADHVNANIITALFITRQIGPKKLSSKAPGEQDGWFSHLIYNAYAKDTTLLDALHDFEVRRQDRQPELQQSATIMQGIESAKITRAPLLAWMRKITQESEVTTIDRYNRLLTSMLQRSEQSLY